MIRAIGEGRSGARAGENTAADGIELSAEQIQRLNDLAPATGKRGDEASMAVVDR